MRKNLLVACLVLACGCSGPRAFTRGTYEDPNVIEMLSDQFSESDLQLIAKKMVDSLAGSPQFQKISGQPLLMVGKVKNRTSEHIDTESLGDKIRVHLTKTGRFAFVNKDARDQIADEYRYQGSGMVAPDQVKGPGQQRSADYLLSGTIASIVQEVGNDKTVYYKLTMELTNLRTDVIEWTEEKELRKKFEKQMVAW